MLNPFSFQGIFNRKQFLLAIVGLGVLEIIIAMIPVTEHEIVFGRLVKSSIGYATPAEPVTAGSWALLCTSLVLRISSLWIMVTAIVRRLHDLEKSNKWLVRFIGLFVTGLFLQAVLPLIGIPMLAVDVIGIIVAFPVGLIAAVGMYNLVFIKGSFAPKQP